MMAGDEDVQALLVDLLRDQANAAATGTRARRRIRIFKQRTGQETALVFD
jgi:hypothetical protein